MYNTDERIAKIISLIDQLKEDYCCSGCDDDLIDNFSYTLNTLYLDENVLNEDLEKISSIETDIFTNDNYYTSDYKNNLIRKKIAEYLCNHKVNNKLILEYTAILNNISDDYKLISYLNPEILNDKERLVNLIIKNSEAISLIDEKIIDTDTMIKILKEADSTIFLMLDGDNVFGYQDTWVYKNRTKYLSNKEIENLFILGLTKYIKEDISNYSKLSLEARNNTSLATMVLDIDPKYICYCGPLVYDNKELMTKMIKLDKENYYYISDNLKSNKDIINIMEGK